MTSTIVYEECPHCKSRSGIDVHGRNWCHACKSKLDFNQMFGTASGRKPKRTFEMQKPQTAVERHPKAAVDWISKFGNIPLQAWFWDSYYNRIVIPYHNEKGELIAAWMRDITERAKIKWMYWGQKVLWIENRSGHCLQNIAIVEDVISGIKVSYHMPVLVLGGTSLPLENIIRLCNRNVNKVLLMLDNDEAGHKARDKIKKNLTSLIEVGNVYNITDPKYYTDNELKVLLKNYLINE